MQRLSSNPHHIRHIVTWLSVKVTNVMFAMGVDTPAALASGKGARFSISTMNARARAPASWGLR